MRAYLLLLAAILCETTGTSFLKLTEGFTRLWPSVITIVAYGLSFYFLSLVLKSMSLGIAYAIWCAVGIALIAIIGWVVYKQSLDLPAIIGIGLIIAGVAVIHLFSKSVAH